MAALSPIPRDIMRQVELVRRTQMVKTIDITGMPTEWATQFESGRKPMLIERNGRRIGIVIAPETLGDRTDSALALLEVLSRVPEENALIPEEEVDADIEQAIREVRAQKN